MIAILTGDIIDCSFTRTTEGMSMQADLPIAHAPPIVHHHADHPGPASKLAYTLPVPPLFWTSAPGRLSSKAVGGVC